jgi:hypothetical protein
MVNSVPIVGRFITIQAYSKCHAKAIQHFHPLRRQQDTVSLHREFYRPALILHSLLHCLAETYQTFLSGQEWFATMKKYCDRVYLRTRNVISQVVGEGIYRLVAHKAWTVPPRLIDVVVHVAVVAVEVTAARHLTEKGVD